MNRALKWFHTLAVLTFLLFISFSSWANWQRGFLNTVVSRLSMSAYSECP